MALLTLKDIYDAEVSKASAGATYDELQSILVDPGQIITITWVTVENKTNAYTKLVVGLISGSTFHTLYDEGAPAAAYNYYLGDKILIPAGHRLGLRLYGCTAADVLRAHLQGYIYFIGD